MAYDPHKANRQEEITRKLADEFIKSLKENGDLPWNKGYDAIPGMTQHNPASGTHYQGVSKLILYLECMEKDYGDPRWLTFNQAKHLGGSVMKGERATWCVRWQPIEELVTDKEGKPLLDDKGQQRKREFLIPCPYAVFNVKQISGLNLPPLEKPNHQWEPHARAEELIKNSKAEIVHSEYQDLFTSPCYIPYLDQISMPVRNQFTSAENYYGTLLHELCHWTGHPKRLNRFAGNADKMGFGQPEYAREELRAEIGSSILCLSLGIQHELDPNSKAYVKSWIKALENDPKEILRAAAQSDKIVTYLRQYDPVKEPPLTPLLAPNNTKIKPQELPQVKEQVNQNVKERIINAQKQFTSRTLSQSQHQRNSRNSLLRNHNYSHTLTKAIQMEK